MLQCRIKLKLVESGLIIFKSNPKQVESGRRCNPTDFQIGRVTMDQHDLLIELDTFPNPDPTRLADITKHKSTNNPALYIKPLIV